MNPIAPKPPPRFLPTLTEVVQIPPVGASDWLAGKNGNLDTDELIDRVMLRLDGPLQAALQAAIGAVVIDKLREIEPRIRDEIDRAVRLTVEEAVTQEISLPR